MIGKIRRAEWRLESRGAIDIGRAGDGTNAGVFVVCSLCAFDGVGHRGLGALERPMRIRPRAVRCDPLECVLFPVDPTRRLPFFARLSLFALQIYFASLSVVMLGVAGMLT